VIEKTETRKGQGKVATLALFYPSLEIKVISRQISDIMLCNPHVTESISSPESSITDLLRRASVGDRHAERHLLDQVYPELRAMAQGHFRFEVQQHTLQPTALVNEIYLKLMGDSGTDWQSRAHFFAVASRAMRQVLIDHARRHLSEKRGGARPISLDAIVPMAGQQSHDLLVIDEALTELGKINSRLAKVVTYRYFGDMTEQEIAEVLGVSTRTVKRDWNFARAWLRDWLSK
jgi:RNA polymerase sigma-70 factor, ECF subfamily